MLSRPTWTSAFTKVPCAIAEGARGVTVFALHVLLMLLDLAPIVIFAMLFGYLITGGSKA